jgi:hypothetical protein
MSNENQISIQRPFGPSVAKVKIPLELIETLNNYVDKTVADEKKIKELDHGSKLAGNVKQEFELDEKFLESSGFLKFLGLNTANWIKFSGFGEIKKFDVLSAWIVRQFKNDYNPTHWHTGHVSGVGYLKVPNSFGETTQKTKKTNSNGKLELIHGSRQFLSNSTLKITPSVGDFYFFPNYMMHTVYPFSGTDEERRSISFNAELDAGNINVYGSQ